MRRLLFPLLLLLLVACGGDDTTRTANAAPGRQNVEKGPPVVLADENEPGERFIFKGHVLDYAGRPLSGVAVTAYHADKSGLYNPPDSPTRVPRIRGVAITDGDGEFRFTSIRPGSYPKSTEPAHIHLMVSAPAHHHRYVTYWFDDDPYVTPEMRARFAHDPEIVILHPTRDPDGLWFFSHDVKLEGN